MRWFITVAAGLLLPVPATVQGQVALTVTVGPQPRHFDRQPNPVVPEWGSPVVLEWGSPVVPSWEGSRDIRRIPGLRPMGH